MLLVEEGVLATDDVAFDEKVVWEPDVVDEARIELLVRDGLDAEDVETDTHETEVMVDV